jgi:branched-chain amino acid aminotransferase
MVTEAGASNFFIIWKNKETGKPELVTPSLDSKLILPGVTRRSVLELARDRLTKANGDLEALDVVEKDFTIQDVEEAWKEGRVIESFVSGTAVSR